MPHIDVDPQTYATVKALAEREERSLKVIVKRAVANLEQPAGPPDLVGAWAEVPDDAAV